MTDKDIKKALECCPDHDICLNCPCFSFCDSGQLFDNALDLINRQQAEIEELSAYSQKLQAEIRDLYDTIDYRAEKIRELEDNLKSAETEVERLREKAEKCFYCTEQANKKIGEIKAEAIKEFLAKLQCEAFLPLGTWFSERVITESQAVAIAKEMVGE